MQPQDPGARAKLGSNLVPLTPQRGAVAGRRCGGAAGHQSLCGEDRVGTERVLPSGCTWCSSALHLRLSVHLSLFTSPSVRPPTARPSHEAPQVLSDSFRARKPPAWGAAGTGVRGRNTSPRSSAGLRGFQGARVPAVGGPSAPSPEAVHQAGGWVKEPMVLPRGAGPGGVCGAPDAGRERARQGAEETLT